MMRKFTSDRFPIKNCLIDFLLTRTVESTSVWMSC